jgi:hypothetical protein
MARKKRRTQLSSKTAAKVRALLGVPKRAHLLIVQTEDDSRYSGEGGPPASERGMMRDTPRSHVLKIQRED